MIWFDLWRRSRRIWDWPWESAIVEEIWGVVGCLKFPVWCSQFHMISSRDRTWTVVVRRKTNWGLYAYWCRKDRTNHVSGAKLRWNHWAEWSISCHRESEIGVEVKLLKSEVVGEFRWPFYEEVLVSRRRGTRRLVVVTAYFVVACCWFVFVAKALKFGDGFVCVWVNASLFQFLLDAWVP